MQSIFNYIQDHCFSSGDGDTTKTKLLVWHDLCHACDGAKCLFIVWSKKFQVIVQIWGVMVQESRGYMKVERAGTACVKYNLISQEVLGDSKLTWRTIKH